MDDLNHQIEISQYTTDSLVDRYNHVYSKNAYLREENDSILTVIINMERGREMVDEIIANSEEKRIEEQKNMIRKQEQLINRNKIAFRHNK